MVTQIALLRGVNVGARGPRVAMADLRAFALDLGFTEPRTLLQSGNLVVDGGHDVGQALERRLESGAAERLGVTIDFIVRTVAEWRTAIDANPFAEAAEKDPSHLLIFFLKAAPLPSAVDDLRASHGRKDTTGRRAWICGVDLVCRRRSEIRREVVELERVEQAVQEHHHVRPALMLWALDGVLVDDKPVIIFWVVEVNDLHQGGDLLTLGLVLNFHAVNNKPMKAAVGVNEVWVI